MSNPIEVRVPDIGDFDEVEVVEVLVAPGDEVEPEDSLVTLESDKASMEIPSPRAGTVARLEVAVGDKVAEGSLLLVLDEAGAGADATAPEPPAAPTAKLEGAQSEPAHREDDDANAPDAEAGRVAREGGLGDAEDAPGAAEPGDGGTGGAVSSESPARAAERSDSSRLPAPERKVGERPKSEPPLPPAPTPGRKTHASPLVRGYARDLGVDLEATSGSGPHGRVLVEDVKHHVRAALAGQGGGGIPAIPEVDFSRFGEVETRKLSRIRRVSATNLSRSWLNLPHVTQHEDADITELERFRKARADEASERGLRLSPLLFVMKAVVAALRAFPDFRSSLSPDGESLIIKHYFHLGVAVDTDQGLIVPVVRDVDRKGVYELAEEVAELADKARRRKLAPSDIQGACFTISSLGGIGGTGFTPIVNAPEVAILGVSRTATRPVWVEGGSDASESGDGHFAPRRILPLSLSYDHRVIDGAAAARFVVHLRDTLSHPANLLL